MSDEKVDYNALFNAPKEETKTTEPVAEPTTETVEDAPVEVTRTVHHINGHPVLLSEEELECHKADLFELEKLQDGRHLADIPLSDAYFDKKKEIDGNVGKMRR